MTVSLHMAIMVLGFTSLVAFIWGNAKGWIDGWREANSFYNSVLRGYTKIKLEGMQDYVKIVPEDSSVQL